MQALEARFERYEDPLLFVSLLLNPQYKSVDVRIIGAGAVIVL